MVNEVPFPFQTRAQYERAVQQPVGREWNTIRTFNAMTRPAVATKAGTIIEPMKLTKVGYVG